MRVRIIGDKQLQMQLNKMSRNIKKELNKGLSESGTHLKNKVKDKFGEYQKGWPKLKRETVIAKYRRRSSLNGFSRGSFNAMSSAINVKLGSDEPLSLFNKLKESIEKEDGNLQTTVYSDNEYAAVHEYGYRQVPARSYMRLTLDEESDEVYKIIYNRIGRLI